MKEIVVKKIKKLMREKVSLTLNDVVIEPLFTKEILEYPPLGTLKSPRIDSYDGTKDPIDHIHTF